jgi:hypothetical protein
MEHQWDNCKLQITKNKEVAMAYVTSENLPVATQGNCKETVIQLLASKSMIKPGISQIQSKQSKHITAFSNVCKTQAMLLHTVPKFIGRMAR